VVKEFDILRVNVTLDLVDVGFDLAEKLQNHFQWRLVSNKDDTFKYLKDKKNADILIKEPIIKKAPLQEVKKFESQISNVTYTLKDHFF
jgi:hypothetical protein